MGGISEFRRKVLSCPVLVMLAIAPKATGSYVVDLPLKGDVNRWFVLPIV